jgi:hypothetical protein
MHYAIFDSTGNLVESFEDEESARKALGQIVDAEPEAAEHVALFVYGRTGCLSASRSLLAPWPAFAEVRSSNEPRTLAVGCVPKQRRKLLSASPPAADGALG